MVCNECFGEGMLGRVECVLCDGRGERFTFFWKGYLSQWHKCKFEEDGIIYNCAEQYMMFKKAELMNDLDSMRLIIASSDPAAQKSLGRLVSNYDQVKWDQYKERIVYEGNYLKFSQNQDLKSELLSTINTTLVEASPYDRIWGIGLSEKNPKCFNRSEWRGQNLLGEILTAVRESLISDAKRTFDIAPS